MYQHINYDKDNVGSFDANISCLIMFCQKEKCF